MNEQVDDFVTTLYQKIEEAEKKYSELRQELDRLKLKEYRTAEYIRQLNDFIVREGGEPVPFEEIK